MHRVAAIFVSCALVGAVALVVGSGDAGGGSGTIRNEKGVQADMSSGGTPSANLGHGRGVDGAQQRIALDADDIGRRIRIWVVTEQGAGVGGVEVSLSRGRWRLSKKSDRNGRVEIEVAREHSREPIQLDAVGARAIPVEVPRTIAPGENEVVVEVVRRARISGIVSDESGRFVSGARVYFVRRGENGRHSPRHQATTDESGQYAFAIECPLHDGDAVLVAADGKSSSCLVLDLSFDSGDGDIVRNFVVNTGLELDVCVRHRNSEPIAGLGMSFMTHSTVFAPGEPAEEMLGSEGEGLGLRHERQNSGANGRVRVTNWPPGRATRISIYDRGYFSTIDRVSEGRILDRRTAVIPAGTARVDMVVRRIPLRELEVRGVLSATSRAAIRRVTVEFDGGGAVQLATTAAGDRSFTATGRFPETRIEGKSVRIKVETEVGESQVFGPYVLRGSWVITGLVVE